MPPSKKQKQEIQVSKSPAEFFAENQAIAGFDNLGKSLFTTIRELIENSLDACESVNILPDIIIKIEEMNEVQFNKMRGVNMGRKGMVDEALFQKKGVNATSTASTGDNSDVSGKKKKGGKIEDAYFKISVRDNGCGMSHEAIPELLGRVLSGSKYGVRQTRGKFGLGAKMALIWSKKSTGVPIKITSSHINTPEYITSCVLDIDIYKNSPNVIEHTKLKNTDNWIGTEFEVTIAGTWSSYKSRILTYLQQLAIITPYAKLEMQYSNVSDPKKDMTIRYDRRSEQMPAPAREVKHHPSSVNNLLVQQLVDKSNSTTLLKFLCEDLSGITPNIAKRVIAELGHDFEEEMDPSELDNKHITRLVQILRSVELFKPPDGSCLSPLGEYNLNLGIRKVIEPDIVATARDKPSAYEGHPFIVEAAISLGGKSAKEGINIIRFANRIPLLFESGADVVSRVAQNKIKWSSYKIDHKRDKICCFVSIVSTKIPFKGTGKEYIGDDITEIQTSVKRALQSCCQQLRSQLSKRNAIRDAHERTKRLTKYIPNATQSIFGILDQMRKRKLDQDDAIDTNTSPRKIPITAAAVERIEKDCKYFIDRLENKQVSEDTFRDCLFVAISTQAKKQEDSDGDVSNGKIRQKDGAQTVYIKPIYDIGDNSMDIYHPLFVFRPIYPNKQKIASR